MTSVTTVARLNNFAVDCDLQTQQALAPSGMSVYHHPGWQKAFDVYGLRTHWLLAEREGKRVGILPLVCQSSKLFGHRLISLPWVDEAGAIGDQGAVVALLQNAVLLAKESGNKFSIVVKQPLFSEPLAATTDWSHRDTGKVLMWRRLGMPADDLWKEFSPKVRNQVRKAEKNGLVTERGGIELVEDFFQVYSLNMRDLGSPSHSLKFFHTLLEALGDRANIYCTRHEGAAVGAGLVLDNRPSLDIPWASSLLAYNRLCVNHAMYWQILSDACEAGYERFHFGRSDVGSGQHKFKKQWGAEEQPLSWLQYTPQSKPAGQENSTAMKEKFGLAQQIWAKLPLPVAQRLGPFIIRHVQ